MGLSLSIRPSGVDKWPWALSLRNYDGIETSYHRIALVDAETAGALVRAGAISWPDQPNGIPVRAKARIVAAGMDKPGVWPIGTRVKKKRGSQWHGRVVGYYATDLTPDGYCIESERELGSVQIYPASALEKVEALAHD